MDLSSVSDSSRPAELASQLIQEWQQELPAGALRDQIARVGAILPGWTDEHGYLAVAHDDNTPYSIYGWRESNGHYELIGPYVAKRYRRQGIGRWALKCASLLSGSEPVSYLLVPMDNSWAGDVLENMGFEPTAVYLADGVGDHRAFMLDHARRAQQVLHKAGEPRGRGPWRVVLHNDDRSTFEFVAKAVGAVLDLNQELAWHYAILVHHAGFALLRNCRTHWGAQRLVDHITRMARRDDFPLRATVEHDSQ